MQWQLEGDRPIYQQLVDQIMMQIVSGQRKAGDKVPAVRELAAEAGVNPNTVQRAFQELEKEGLGRSGAPGPSVHQSDQRTVCDGG